MTTIKEVAKYLGIDEKDIKETGKSQFTISDVTIKDIDENLWSKDIEIEFSRCIFEKGLIFHVISDRAIGPIKSKLTFVSCTFKDIFKATFEFFNKDFICVKCTFEKETYFGNATFMGGVKFSGSRFKDMVSFSDAKFENKNGNSDFKHTQFEKEVTFYSATFMGGVKFSGSIFKDIVSFTSTKFKNESGGNNFKETQFEGEASFVSAEFMGGVDFSRSKFKDMVNFTYAKFKGKYEKSDSEKFENGFIATQFESDVIFLSTDFYGSTKFQMTKFLKDSHWMGVTFNEYVVFDNTYFGGNASFRSNEDNYKIITNFKKVYFKNVIFEKSQFYEVQFKEDANFDGVTFKDLTHFYKTTFNKEANFQGSNFGGITSFDENQFTKKPNFLNCTFSNQFNIEHERLKYQYEDIKKFENNILPWRDLFRKLKSNRLAYHNLIDA